MLSFLFEMIKDISVNHNELYDAFYIWYSRRVDSLLLYKADVVEVAEVFDTLLNFTNDDRFATMFKIIYLEYEETYPQTCHYYMIEYVKQENSDAFKGTDFEQFFDEKNYKDLRIN